MKKIISFSLWGTNEFYTHGAIENILDAKEYFPDFTCRFYVDPLVPKYIKDYIKEHAEYIEISKEMDHLGKNCLRFLPFFDDDVDIFLSRDADSRLTEREAKIINKWINEDQTGFLSLYEAGGRGDGCLIDAGMFACNNNFFRNELNSIYKISQNFFKRANGRLSDREYLNNIIFPIVKNSFTGYANFQLYGGYHERETYDRLLDEDIEIEDMPFELEIDEETGFAVNHKEVIGNCIPEFHRVNGMFNMKNYSRKKLRKSKVNILIDCKSNDFNDKLIEIYWKKLIHKVGDHKYLSSDVNLCFLYGNSYNKSLEIPSNYLTVYEDIDDKKKSASLEKILNKLEEFRKSNEINYVFRTDISNIILIENLLEYLFDITYEEDGEFIIGNVKKYNLFDYVSKEAYIFSKSTYNKIIKFYNRINLNTAEDMSLGFLLKSDKKIPIKNILIENLKLLSYEEIKDLNRKVKDDNHFLISFKRSSLKIENLDKIRAIVNNFF